MATDFTPDPAGIDAVLAATQPRLKALADGIVAEAQSSGPRNPRHRDHTIDHIAVGAFRVTATGAEQDIDWPSPFWHFIEFGSVHQAPSRVLTRAAQNAGLELKDRGKH